MWYLVNASPDLRTQLNAHPELQPRPESVRNSPIGAVLLTNADLDHLLGLFSLREGDRLAVYAPRLVASAAGALGLDGALGAFCGIEWREPSMDDFIALNPKDTEGALACRAIALSAAPPLFAQDSAPDGVHSVAYQFLDRRTGGRLLVAPDVAGVNDRLLEVMKDSDAVLFDGTFWSDDELSKLRPGARSARQMGHMTIRDSSLDLLRRLPGRHKVYTHINNTNPVLAADSAERRAVESAGVAVGHDGQRFEL